MTWAPTDPAVAGQIAAALGEHRRRLWAEGVSLLPDVAALESACRRVRKGHDTPVEGSGGVTSHDCDAAGSTVVLLTYEQVARRLGVSLSTVKRAVAAGRLPAVRVGVRGRRVEWRHAGLRVER